MTAARHAAILAGGAGSRLGGAKATADLAGRPLISYAIAAARAAGLEPLVVAKLDSPLPALDCELIAEADEPRHPLTGVVAALERVDAPVVTLPCDLPLLPAAALGRLATTDAGLAVAAGERLHPTLARWTPELLPELRAAQRKGEALARTASRLDAELIDARLLTDPVDPAVALLNVNDHDDLALAAQQLRA